MDKNLKHDAQINANKSQQRTRSNESSPGASDAEIKHVIYVNCKL